jgi:hypothetical protein
MFLQTKRPTSRSRCHQAVITLRFAIETGFGAEVTRRLASSSWPGAWGAGNDPMSLVFNRSAFSVARVVRWSKRTPRRFSNAAMRRLRRVFSTPIFLADACGTFSQTKRDVGLLRLLQAGVITTDYASLMVEI